MKTIALTQNKVALVDDADFDSVNQFKWHAFFNGWNWYARRNLPRDGKPLKKIALHQYLLPGHLEIDHKNGNGLDNQRHNLRRATRAQNGANTRKMVGCSSQFKGVFWNKRDDRWRAAIHKVGKNIHLGSFDLESEAAKAYDVAARELFGEFAKTNF